MNMYGPQAALIAESFAPHLRYSGAGLGHELASIIAGGQRRLLRRHCSPPIIRATRSVLHPGLRFISIVATRLLKDYTNKDIS